jgi:hypothetical protein
MEGKMKLLQYVLAFGVFLGLTTAMKAADNNPDYIVNQSVGKTEQEILNRFGRPKSVETLAARELIGPLRGPVRKDYFHHQPNVQVREVYYHSKRGENFFWLTQKSKKWVVVTDLWVAPGVQF